MLLAVLSRKEPTPIQFLSVNQDTPSLCPMVRIEPPSELSALSIPPLQSIPSHVVVAGILTLPGPPANAQLVAIGIGRGVEYYTCDNATAMPEHNGGKADIYDANDVIQYLPNERYLHDLVKYFYNYDYGLLENSSLSLLGKTYYSPQPTFDLGDKGFFQGSVDYSVQSPLANAYVRAIDWAQLSKTSENSTINYVFRVETYGGGGPCDCKGQPQLSTWQYACEYWFYA
jgi:hypothetical protein